MAKKDKITVQGTEIMLFSRKKEAYISLTDMAKYKNAEIPAHVISHWLSTKYTIEFMGIWELINNTNFNLTEFREVKNASGGSFTLSPKQWIERTNAIGITAKPGRYARFRHIRTTCSSLEYGKHKRFTHSTGAAATRASCAA